MTERVTDRQVETYQGILILHDSEDGFYASHGLDTHFGFTDTIEEIREEIDAFWQGDEHGPLNGIFNGGNA